MGLLKISGQNFETTTYVVTVLCSCKPIESIRDISSFLSPVWTKTAGYAAGKTWSLNEVENYLRNPKPFQ